jgi:hypothetical protein
MNVPPTMEDVLRCAPTLTDHLSAHVAQGTFW